MGEIALALRGRVRAVRKRMTKFPVNLSENRV